MVISSLSNDLVKDIVKLRDKKYRDLVNQFIVEGYHLVSEAYKSGLLVKLIKLESINSNFDIETIDVTNEVMNKISELSNSSEYIGICKYKDMIEDYDNNILVLNNVQDPGNFGTIIRSAIGFNLSTIVVDCNTVDVYNSKVIRATQGMIFNINVIKKDLKLFCNDMKDNGYKIYSASANGNILLKDMEKNKKSVIIMGNEGTGVEEYLLNICDDSIKININDKCESLNVGVAASIILYELSR